MNQEADEQPVSMKDNLNPQKKNRLGNKPKDEYNDEEPEDYLANPMRNQSNQTRNSHEEIAIKHSSKTFEQMLEEEMMKAGGAPEPEETKVPQKPKPQKTFLKKGSTKFLSSGKRKGTNTGKTSAQLSTNELPVIPENVTPINNDDVPVGGGMGGFGGGIGSKEDDSKKSKGDLVNEKKAKQPRKFLAKGSGSGGGVKNKKDTKVTNKLGKNSEKNLDDGDVDIASSEVQENFNNQKKNNKKGKEEMGGENQNEFGEEFYEDIMRIKQYNPMDYIKKNEESDEGEQRDASKSPSKINQKNRKSEKKGIRKNPFNDDEDEEMADLRKEVEQVNEELNHSIQQKFDDDKEWKDDQKLYNQISGNNNQESPRGHVDNSDDETRASKKSKLVETYFGGGKKKAKSKKDANDVQKSGQANLDLTKEDEEEIVKKYVNERIDKQNEEVARFTMENERVAKLRKKHDDMMRGLQKEKDEFEQLKMNEKRELDDWKEEEAKKVKRDKKIAERNQKAMSNMPNRKERDEIDNLKAQITKLTEELRGKDKKSKYTIDRQKKTIEELNDKNKALETEIKYYAQLRLKEGKKPIVPAEAMLFKQDDDVIRPEKESKIFV